MECEVVELTDSTGGSFQDDRAPKVLLVEGWIAGIFYYDAARVASQLADGQILSLRRESSNPHDGNAVELLTDEGVKLGYIPRRLNSGIARRLDEGFSLRGEVTHIERDGERLGIRFKVFSLIPGDQADPAPQRWANAAVQQQATPRPYHQVSSVANHLCDARRSLAKGDRPAAYRHLETAMNWALDLWSERHPRNRRRPSTWVAIFQEFMQEATEPLRRRVGILTLVQLSLFVDDLPSNIEARQPEQWLQESAELLQAWRMRYIGKSEDGSQTAVGTRRIDRLDWAFLSEISAVTAILTRDPFVAAPISSRAERLPVARREQVLRCLFRWFRLMDDHERLGVIPISRMKAVRALNWDRAFIIELQVAELRQLLEIIPRTPEEERRHFESGQRWPGLFPDPPILFSEKRRLIALAIDLIESEPCPRAALLRLAEELRTIQPQTRRRKRRRVRIAVDHALYLAECFARNTASETPDLYVTARLLTVCVPYRHLDRWRLHDLDRFADTLAERYFGVSQWMLRNAAPPPSFAQSSSIPAGLWLWRDNGPILPETVTPYALVTLWGEFGQWAIHGQVDWRDPLERESYRQGLHLRALTREQILVSPRRLARRLKPWLDEADFDFLAGTQSSPHVWGEAWEQAYGNSPGTHWWYYRTPVGFRGGVEKLS